MKFDNQWAPMGGMDKIVYAIVGHLLGCLYGKAVEIIGLQALGIYSASFWSNKISALLCAGPKPNISIISGFLTPRGPLFMDFNIPKYYVCKSGNQKHIC